MGNVFDYLDWRGDIGFEKVGITDADTLVFSAMAYLPFDRIVPDDCDGDKINLSMALQKMIMSVDKSQYHLKEDLKLAKHLLNCPRFTALDVTGYVNIFETEKQEQFSAVTFIMPGGDNVITFRGTDGTIVGWKEDFNMGILETIPSQEDALTYLRKAALRHKGDFYICGHSKGGNLSMYCAAFCEDEIKDRIVSVWNLDGPGFNTETVSTQGYIKIKDRIKSFLPQSSVVGMLLEHEEDSTVIHSKATSILQHNIYSWEIKRADFVKEDSLRDSSLLVDSTMKDWIIRMDPEKRTRLTDGLYTIFSGLKAKSLSELTEPRNIIEIMKNAANLDPETKSLVNETAGIFKESYKMHKKK